MYIHGLGLCFSYLLLLEFLLFILGGRIMIFKDMMKAILSKTRQTHIYLITITVNLLAKLLYVKKI